MKEQSDMNLAAAGDRRNAGWTAAMQMLALTIFGVSFVAFVVIGLSSSQRTNARVASVTTAVDEIVYARRKTVLLRATDYCTDKQDQYDLFFALYVPELKYRAHSTDPLERARLAAIRHRAKQYQDSGFSFDACVAKYEAGFVPVETPAPTAQ